MGRLSMESYTTLPSLPSASPVESNFSTESTTSESVVFSPLEVKSDPEDFFPSAAFESIHDLASPTEAPAQKRKRGRPRKHPVIPIKPKNGRSRTGCITCRRRKKKCDETKPECEQATKPAKVLMKFHLIDSLRPHRHELQAHEQSL